MSGTLSVRDGKKLARKNPLADKPLRVNTIVRRGYFAGQEIIDKTRMHLEPAELQRFFAYMPVTSFWYPYFFIQYFYGCRLSEPALLLDEDISFDKQQIVIRRLNKVSEAAGYKEHVYPMDPRVLECVKTAHRWKTHREQQDNPFLFPSQRRRAKTGAERLSQLRNIDGWQAVSRFTAHRVFKQIAKALKLPDNLQHSHVLRHTRATLLLASGVAEEQVQYLLGHSNVQMTRRYLGVAESMRDTLNSEVLRKGLGL
jgi:integrase